MTASVEIALAFVALIVMIFFGSYTTVKEGNVGITVLFGRYRRILHPGLSFRIPFAERIYKVISLQHRSVEIEFQATTNDQANVNFKTLIIYSVLNREVETLKRAAFKFIDERSFMQALIRSVEGSVRSYVATKSQNEILGLRKEIVDEINAHIEHELNDWGYHLSALQINDISFDEAIMRSMAQVVATNNMKMAAENEAQAQYISKTRVAEAEAHARRVVAEADRDAEEMRGQGNALLRRNMARGFADAEKIMSSAGVDSGAMHYEMWLDTMKHVASEGTGNLLTFDGSVDGFDKTMRQMTVLGKASGKSRQGAEASGPNFERD